MKSSWEVEYIEEEGIPYLFTPEEEPVMVVADYLAEQHNNSALNTQMNIVRALALWFEFLDIAALDYRKVKTEHIPDFKAWLKSRIFMELSLNKESRIVSSSLNSYLSIIKNFYTRHVKEYVKSCSISFQYAKEDSTYTSKKRRNKSIYTERADKIEPSGQYITNKEQDMILSKLGNRDRLIIKLFFATGLRSGELHGLSTEDFKSIPREDIVFIAPLHEHYSENRRKQLKTDIRDIAMDANLARLVSKYIKRDRSENRKTHSSIFTTKQNSKSSKVGDPLSAERIYKIFKDACKKCNLNYRIHDTRHTFITNMFIGGAPLRSVMEFVGHKNPDTTDKYDRRSLQDLAKESGKILSEIGKWAEHYEQQ